MGGAAGKLADRFHLLSLAKQCLGAALFSDFAGHLVEAHEGAVILDRVDNIVGKKSAAILAQAPAFILEAANLRCRFD